MFLSGIRESVWLEKTARFGKEVQSSFWDGAQTSARAEGRAMKRQARLNSKETDRWAARHGGTLRGDIGAHQPARRNSP
jgi:hypothetical protein